LRKKDIYILELCTTYPGHRQSIQWVPTCLFSVVEETSLDAQVVCLTASHSVGVSLEVGIDEEQAGVSLHTLLMQGMDSADV